MNVGSPTQVRRTPYFPAALPGFNYRPYDISPDGRRFLMIKEIADDQPGAPGQRGIIVVFNWPEELKRSCRRTDGATNPPTDPRLRSGSVLCSRLVASDCVCPTSVAAPSVNNHVRVCLPARIIRRTCSRKQGHRPSPGQGHSFRSWDETRVMVDWTAVIYTSSGNWHSAQMGRHP
jgi:hypothetical protein